MCGFSDRELDGLVGIVESAPSVSIHTRDCVDKEYGHGTHCIVGLGTLEVFIQIRQSVAIRIKTGIIDERIEFITHFVAIGHPVAVRVVVFGIGAPRKGFLAVAQSVMVAVDAPAGVFTSRQTGLGVPA